MPPTHMFLIEVSHTAVSSGAVAAACSAIADCLDALQGWPPLACRFVYTACCCWASMSILANCRQFRASVRAAHGAHASTHHNFLLQGGLSDMHSKASRLWRWKQCQALHLVWLLRCCQERQPARQDGHNKLVLQAEGERMWA